MILAIIVLAFISPFLSAWTLSLYIKKNSLGESFYWKNLVIAYIFTIVNFLIMVNYFLRRYNWNELGLILFALLISFNILLFYEILKKTYKFSFYISLKLFLGYIVISILFITSPLLVRFLKEVYILNLTTINTGSYCNKIKVNSCEPSLMCKVYRCDITPDGQACMANPSCGAKQIPAQI